MQQRKRRSLQTDPLEFTFTFQLIKATEELLAEAIAENYEGYVKIIADISHKKNMADQPALLDVRLEKLGKPIEWSRERLAKQCSEQNCAIFDVVPGKGCKRILV